ncbi:hypothetical protein G7Y89_g4452 [Cudoniella acicularis]|uniref:Uncharacterized protein n=1 Tax=Cudoniella acicularis TaxID=354080 RepID=A0A8H4RPF0_9HELO|nr:hypothetical protein G7Y89_g4452 [Cudoniella acicularis]
MPQSYPSIQSFYKRTVPMEKQDGNPQAPPIPGDGFTEEELADTLDPLNRKWNPEREYEELTINQLVPGPKSVTFVGRTLRRRMAYLSMTFLVTANMFPGRVTSDHVMIHTNNSTGWICRTPLEYRKGQPLPGLMTLNSYLRSGHDGVSGAKIAVCVKSIGAKRKIKKKTGSDCELVEVLLFDHTGEVRLSMWNDMGLSPREWQAGKTILLISNPGYRVEYSSKGSLGVVRQTMIEVEPEFPDAQWLRKYAVGLTKKESLCLEFPEGLWDVEAAEYGVYRNFYTLAELDTWVRSDSHQVFSGFINVTIMEMSLVSYHRRNMLMCAECCGVPIYSNALTTPCRNCDKPLKLTLNPKIIGTLLDETGCVAPGKLLWNQRAWEQLFNRTTKEITEMTSDEAKLYEMRMLFLRVHLVVGWEGGVGRLAVLGTMM